MNNFVQQMIQKKFKQITAEELLRYSKQYGITITKDQAIKITAFIKNTKLNPVNTDDRLKMFKKLAQLTNMETAQKAQKLFNQLVKEHGVESWFK